jgi:hypothetical protein
MLVGGTWYQCPPQNETQIVAATTEGGYNEFYNRMYDVGNTGGTCPRTGGFHQDYEQCAAVWCPPSCCTSSALACGEHYICAYNADAGNCQCEFVSPIIIDTTGKGFHLTSAADGVMFDISGDGHPVKLAWTAADSGNAWLALDRNHDGKIGSGKELFGNFTAQPKSSDPNGSWPWRSSTGQRMAGMAMESSTAGTQFIRSSCSGSMRTTMESLSLTNYTPCRNWESILSACTTKMSIMKTPTATGSTTDPR